MYTILMFGTAQAVLIRGVSLFQGCPYFRVSLFQGCPYFRGVFISGVSLFQGCPYFRGVFISGVSLFQGCSYFRCPYFRGILISNVLFKILEWSAYFKSIHISGCH